MKSIYNKILKILLKQFFKPEYNDSWGGYFTVQPAAPATKTVANVLATVEGGFQDYGSFMFGIDSMPENAWEAEHNGITFSFNMENDKLVSVTVSGSTMFDGNQNGIYTAPTAN